MLHEMIEADRLTRLAGRIRVAGHYDQAMWWLDPECDYSLYRVYADTDGHLCGTPCCIIGHAFAQAWEEGFLDDIKMPFRFVNDAFPVNQTGGHLFAKRYLSIGRFEVYKYLCEASPLRCMPRAGEAADMLLFLRDTQVLNPWTIHPWAIHPKEMESRHVQPAR